MLLRKWENLPSFMQTDEVRLYYDLLDSKRGQLFLKRCFDIIASSILIIVLSPVMIFVAIWIKLDSNGTVFFSQERVTQYGQHFCIYKFRTMVQNADKIGSSVTVTKDSRITKVGEKIRKSRIDEIPQLFNVLFGDMSFVGTRPEVPIYVDSYTREMYATLLLPAGITSNASIEFKDEDKIIEEFKVDSKDINRIYIENILPVKMKINLDAVFFYSFKNDLQTMIKTVMKV